MTLTTTPDFDVQHHIAIALLRPDTDDARAWCNEHLVTNDVLMWGRAYVVEPHYLEGILRAIVQDGLTVKLRD
jgi:hypothetical protein